MSISMTASIFLHIATDIPISADLEVPPRDWRPVAVRAEGAARRLVSKHHVVAITHHAAVDVPASTLECLHLACRYVHEPNRPGNTWRECYTASAWPAGTFTNRIILQRISENVASMQTTYGKVICKSMVIGQWSILRTMGNHYSITLPIRRIVNKYY